MPNNWKTNKAAGPDWLSSFMRRHPTLSTRVPEATSLNRTNVGLFFFFFFQTGGSNGQTSLTSISDMERGRDGSYDEQS